MFRRPMIFSGLALALLAGVAQPSIPQVVHSPTAAPPARRRRSGKGRPGLTRARLASAPDGRFTTHGKRARQRRRSRHLQGRG